MSQPTIQIIKEGPDPTVIPKAGQRVKVHYTGTLTNGTKFDSSRDRGKPFEFVLGAGNVIKGWDYAVARMSLGTKANVSCPPDWAYGEKGHPGIIPPSATLNFEMEIMEFS